MSIGEIIGNFDESLSLRRRAAGSTALGRFTPGSVTTTTISAVVVPASGRDLLRLPEGERASATIRVLIESELLATPGSPDELTFQGVTWVVKHVARWSIGSFYDCLAQQKMEG